ncbi:Tex-like protein, HTH domain protein [Nannochloropsis gaditana]|uniref:Tex-like protein, HTH domain protein n=1 Tax=Nannochloropsis gaditana TaxID=72520 RepID=W7TPP1_9STRA|nr:Tex-like protein, HTH domain protein [Nannochloropsis gaditana]
MDHATQHRTMPHPLLMGWLFKQANLMNLYGAMKAYGFHRVYRRLLEANNRLMDNSQDRRIVRENIKQAMRAPNHVVEILDESHTVAFLTRYAKELTTGLETRAPPFFVNAARVVLQKTPMGRLLRVFSDWQDTSRRKKGTPPKPPT